MEKEAAKLTAYGKIKYIDIIPMPLVGFEMGEVIDVLLQDVGVVPERHAMETKGFGWWGWRA